MIDIFFIVKLSHRIVGGVFGGIGSRMAIFMAVLMTCLVVQGCSVVDQVGGDFHKSPTKALSPEAQALVDRAFKGVRAGDLRDFHTHLIGLGSARCDTGVNPKMLTWIHPLKRIEALVYLSAAGVENEQDVDAEYLARLVALIKAMPKRGKFHLLAIDWHYDAQHRRSAEKTTFFVANECVVELANDPRYRGLFVPVISVHPYRADAVQILERWAKKGVRYVKWLPNAQGMDAGDPAIDDYYKTMIRNNLILLTHVGEEKAVDADEDQALGNPLCFRRPLDMGVKVVMAHSGSLGKSVDIDSPGSAKREWNFELFVRLMREERYRKNLFGEISAMTQHNRLTERPKEDAPLVQLLRHADLRGMLETRFVNGSDYPLPAINILVRTRTLVGMGMLTPQERTALNEIYRRNPLEYDFVVKRTLRWPSAEETPDDKAHPRARAIRLPDGLFRIPPGLEKPYPADLIGQLDDPKFIDGLSKIRCRR
ncbi:MAG: amidohydrolase [Alphaproteobacteria bacterium]|nr:amidohydrolase [Alphaproteobacteria bacterium]